MDHLLLERTERINTFSDFIDYHGLVYSVSPTATRPLVRGAQRFATAAIYNYSEFKT